LLPESKMILDAIKKRMFSKPQAQRTPEFFREFFTFLWANFDDKGYSLWASDYIDNSDNTLLWKTSNLIGGNCKDYEENAKYVFGVLNVYSKNEDTAPYKVNGACIMRGTQGLTAKNVPFGMGAYAESHRWTRLDCNNSEHRKKFEELFSSERFGNEEVLDRKFYK